MLAVPADEPVDELGAELGVPPRRIDLDVLAAGAFHLAPGVPAEGDHPQPGLLGLGDGLADLLVEPAPGHVVSIRHPIPAGGPTVKTPAAPGPRWWPRGAPSAPRPGGTPLTRAGAARPPSLPPAPRRGA